MQDSVCFELGGDDAGDARGEVSDGGEARSGLVLFIFRAMFMFAAEDSLLCSTCPQDGSYGLHECFSSAMLCRVEV